MTKKLETQTHAENVVSFTVKFARPHFFEGKEYTEIDLSGLDDLTAEDLSYCEGMFAQMKQADPMKEFNTTFCLLVAQRATNLPFEFFSTLKISNATRIKATVSGFLFESA